MTRMIVAKGDVDPLIHVVMELEAVSRMKIAMNIISVCTPVVSIANSFLCRRIQTIPSTIMALPIIVVSGSAITLTDARFSRWDVSWTLIAWKV